MEGVILTPVKRISVVGGDVYHGLKASEESFAGFGEAYFSTVQKGAIKAWKRHREMTLNIVVPIGEIKFVIVDDRHPKDFCEVVLGENNYQRLTVSPGLWMGFSSRREGLNLLMNIASIEHRPEESDRVDMNSCNYHWQ